MSRKKIMKKRIKELQISEYDIAQHLMLSPDVVKGWINGIIPLAYNDVFEISDLLCIDLEMLLHTG